MTRYAWHLTAVSVACATLAAPLANAALIDRGGGLIYDTDRDITWLQDANYAQTSGYDGDGLMNWSAATAWADSDPYVDAGVFSKIIVKPYKLVLP